jgi:tetratricopeptide (TPR) repeat protein
MSMRNRSERGLAGLILSLAWASGTVAGDLEARKTASIDAAAGKLFYMQGQFKESIDYLERAVTADPVNSNYIDWLGKAYGRRADQSIFVKALPLAVKTRQCFEKAVALDPANLEALSDLFEFDLEAPALIGGGLDKAEAIASRIAPLSPAEGHFARARLAEKRKDPRDAEAEYRRASDAAAGDVGRVLDLAQFLSKHGRYEESERLFEQAQQAEPDSARVVFARAAAYIHGKRNLPEAQSLLRQYASLPHAPDDPPPPEVARLRRELQ